MTRLKPLSEQTIVITGPTSGIGLVTARKAAAAGANLMLVARNEAALQRLSEELRGTGVAAHYAVADVGDEAEVQRAAELAIDRLGGFDTWINNAAVAIYGRIEDVATEDLRRLFDTNFWGVVYGSRAALRHFRGKEAGKIINMGSVLGERAIPLQGIYAASKHAIAGFTESLRIEVDRDDLPVSITLIKPSAIDTPYKDHAKNYMAEAPQNPPPVYAPDVVAEAILHAAEHDVRDIVVGAAGRLINAAANLAPRLADHVMSRVMEDAQRRDAPARPRQENALYRPMSDLRERGGYGFTLERSLYTKARMNPVGTTAVGLLAVAALVAAWNARHPPAR